MAADLAGKVGVYGIDGGLAYTGLVKTANILKGTSVSQTFREAQLEKAGLIIGKAGDLKKRNASFTLVVFASAATTSAALTAAKALVVLPVPLGEITISDYSITLFDGAWTIVGDSTATAREDGYLEITCNGEQVWNGTGYVAYSALQV